MALADEASDLLEAPDTPFAAGARPEQLGLGKVAQEVSRS